jgi:hypothetical protein
LQKASCMQGLGLLYKISPLLCCMYGKCCKWAGACPDLGLCGWRHGSSPVDPLVVHFAGRLNPRHVCGPLPELLSDLAQFLHLILRQFHVAFGGAACSQFYCQLDFMDCVTNCGYAANVAAPCIGINQCQMTT